LTLGACAQASTNAADPSPGVTGVHATYAGRLAQPVNYSVAGISLTPPTGDPRLDWPSAVSTCDTARSVCAANSPATLTLPNATTTNALVHDQLVYVLTFTGVPCRPVGPATTPPAPQTCTTINLIDADSGEVLFSAEGPQL